MYTGKGEGLMGILHRVNKQYCHQSFTNTLRQSKNSVQKKMALQEDNEDVVQFCLGDIT